MAEADVADALSRRGAVLIEGVRWCAKTWAALRFARSTLRLDDPDALTLADADAAEALRGDTPRLVDEWQNAPHLRNRIRRECDDRAVPGQFILTGSASPREDITRHTGTGRIGRITLRPMSLLETSISDGSVSLRSLFDGNTVARAARDEIGLRDIATSICGRVPCCEKRPRGTDGARLAVEVKLGHRPRVVDAAARSLLRLRDKVTAARRADLAGLVVVTAGGPAFRRPDGVQVVPSTTLGP